MNPKMSYGTSKGIDLLDITDYMIRNTNYVTYVDCILVLQAIVYKYMMCRESGVVSGTIICDNYQI